MMIIIITTMTTTKSICDTRKLCKMRTQQRLRAVCARGGMLASTVSGCGHTPVAETLWSAKPKIVITWPFTKKKKRAADLSHNYVTLYRQSI